MCTTPAQPDLSRSDGGTAPDRYAWWWCGFRPQRHGGAAPGLVTATRPPRETVGAAPCHFAQQQFTQCAASRAIMCWA
jgi:hypothetical protein